MFSPLEFGCQTKSVNFEDELVRVLPPGIPHRGRLIEKSAQHLRLIAAANEYMNITRISSPMEAAIKHVFDSVAPWQYFKDARLVLDAGTGAGFPGIPLAIALPDVRFILAESIQKKSRFVESAVDALDLPNVEVSSARAESLALSRSPRIIAARAVAPVHRLMHLFEKALHLGAHLLLYKGPNVEAELAHTNGR
jgi:16S rRNA (guanine527-N7)-methyltransferase